MKHIILINLWSKSRKYWPSIIEKMQTQFDITGVFHCDFNFDKNKKIHEQAAEWIHFYKEYYDIEHSGNSDVDKLNKKVIEQARKTMEESRKKDIDLDSLDKKPREDLLCSAAELVLEYEQSPLKTKQIYQDLRKKSIEIMLAGGDFITMIANISEKEISDLNETKRAFRKKITGSDRSWGLLHASSNLDSGLRMFDLISGNCTVQEITELKK